MKNKNVFLLIAVILSFITISCKTAELGFKVVDINGMVYDFSNRPVAFCDISLGKKYKSTTDINGRFTLPKVPLGNYTMTGAKKGFENYTDEVFVRERGQIIYIRIPSQNQLLNLVEEALNGNNFTLAEEMAERAYQIDNKNIEMLFYYAAVKFRQAEYEEAIGILENAKNFGMKDPYVDKFLIILKELRNVEKGN